MTADNVEINYKSDGEILYGSDVRENLTFPLVQVLYLSSDTSRTSDDTEGYFYSLILTIADYANSTCFRKGDFAFCTLMDECADGSLDTINLYTTTQSGTGGSSEQSSGETGYISVAASENH